MKISVILKDPKSEVSAVMLRLSHDGERKYITLGHVNVADWDADKCRTKRRDGNGLALNSNIELELNEMQRRVIRLRTHNMRPTIERVLEREIRTNRLSEYMEQFIDEYTKGGKVYSAKLFKAVLKRIKVSDVNVNLIDDKWTSAFMHRMHDDDLSNTTQHVYMRVMKIVLNKCVRDGVLNRNPLVHVKIKKDQVFKAKLSLEELDRLRTVQNLTPEQQRALDTFFLALYMYGSRCKDVITLQRSQIKDGRIYMRQSKTGKLHNIKVTQEIIDIIAKYPGGTYVLPWYEGRHFKSLKHEMNFSSNVNSRCNRALKEICKIVGIDKNVTMHVARHTFAVMANRSALRVTDIQRLLNHGSLSITEAYLNELGIDDHLDAEAAKVFK